MQRLEGQRFAPQVFEGSLFRFSGKFTRRHAKTRSFIKIATPVFTTLSQAYRLTTHRSPGTRS
jgi:hypothetical protein